MLPCLYAFQPPLGPGIATVICVGPSGLCLLQMPYDVVDVNFGSWEPWVRMPSWLGHSPALHHWASWLTLKP